MQLRRHPPRFLVPTIPAAPAFPQFKLTDYPWKQHSCLIFDVMTFTTFASVVHYLPSIDLYPLLGLLSNHQSDLQAGQPNSRQGNSSALFLSPFSCPLVSCCSNLKLLSHGFHSTFVRRKLQPPTYIQSFHTPSFCSIK